MGRRIPGKLLPHRGLVIVEPYLGGGANGRSYGPPVTIRRAQIDDSVEKTGDQYDAETVGPATVYFETRETGELLPPESRVTIWAGTPFERTGTVESCGRSEHPQIADFLEVKLR